MTVEAPDGTRSVLGEHKGSRYRVDKRVDRRIGRYPYDFAPDLNSSALRVASPGGARLAWPLPPGRYRVTAWARREGEPTLATGAFVVHRDGRVNW